MPDLQALTHQLLRGNANERIHAAEQLGASGDPAAVGPLLSVLRSLDADQDSLAGAIAVALGALGGREARGELLRWVAMDTEASSAALFALGAVGDPEDGVWLLDFALERVDIGAELFEVAETLGAPAARFVPFLDHEDAQMVAHACAALGRLGAGPSVTEPLAALAGGDIVNVYAALALAALGDPRGEVDLGRALPSLTYAERRSVVAAVAEHRLPGIGRELLKLVGADGWSDSELWATALVAAALAGTPGALDALQQLGTDLAASPCTRLRAAVGFLPFGGPEQAGVVRQHLRENRGTADADPRDPFTARFMAQQAAVEALVAHADTDPSSVTATAELLDGVRRGRFGNPQPVCVAAQHAVERLTGTELYREFEVWLERHRQDPA